MSQRKHTIPGKQSCGKAMRSRSFGTLMSSVAEDVSARLVVSPLGNTSAAGSRLFCKQAEKQQIRFLTKRPDKCDLKRQILYQYGWCQIDSKKNGTLSDLVSQNFLSVLFVCVFTFLMKLFLLWTRLNAGPIEWLELVSLVTKGGAWTCSTSASSRGSSFKFFC